MLGMFHELFFGYFHIMAQPTTIHQVNGAEVGLVGLSFTFVLHFCVKCGIFLVNYTRTNTNSKTKITKFTVSVRNACCLSCPVYCFIYKLFELYPSKFSLEGLVLI